MCELPFSLNCGSRGAERVQVPNPGRGSVLYRKGVFAISNSEPEMRTVLRSSPSAFDNSYYHSFLHLPCFLVNLNHTKLDAKTGGPSNTKIEQGVSKFSHALSKMGKYALDRRASSTFALSWRPERIPSNGQLFLRGKLVLQGRSRSKQGRTSYLDPDASLLFARQEFRRRTSATPLVLAKVDEIPISTLSFSHGPENHQNYRRTSLHTQFLHIARITRQVPP